MSSATATDFESLRFQMDLLLSAAPSGEELIHATVELLANYLQADNLDVWLAHQSTVIGWIESKSNGRQTQKRPSLTEDVEAQMLDALNKGRCVARKKSLPSALHSSESHGNQNWELCLPVNGTTSDSCVFVAYFELSSDRSIRRLLLELDEIRGLIADFLLVGENAAKMATEHGSLKRVRPRASGRTSSKIRKLVSSLELLQHFNCLLRICMAIQKLQLTRNRRRSMSNY